MESGLHNCIYLTQDEFLVLVSSTGMIEIEGLFRTDPGRITQNRAVEAVFSLCEKGLLQIISDRKEEYFQPKPELGEIISRIREAKERLAYYKEEIDRPQVFVYLGEQAVVTELSTTEEDSIRLFTASKEELQEWLSQEGYTTGQAQKKAPKQEVIS